MFGWNFHGAAARRRAIGLAIGIAPALAPWQAARGGAARPYFVPCQPHCAAGREKTRPSCSLRQQPEPWSRSVLTPRSSGPVTTSDVAGEPNPGALSSGTGGQPVTPIDLPSALRLAGAQNPGLVVAYQRTLATTAARQLAAARLLPNLNAGSNFDGHSGVLQQASGNILNVHRDSLYVVRGSGRGCGRHRQRAGRAVQPNLSDSIFNYLATGPAIDRARFLNQAVGNTLQRDVALAYGELLRAEGQRAISRQIRDNAAEVARVTAAFTQAGQGQPDRFEPGRHRIGAALRHLAPHRCRRGHCLGPAGRAAEFAAAGPLARGRILGGAAVDRARPDSAGRVGGDRHVSAAGIGGATGGDQRRVGVAPQLPSIAVLAADSGRL